MKELDYQWVDGKTDAKSWLQRLRAVYKSISALSPIPYLARTRDYIARNMIDCTEMVGYGGMVAVSGLAMALPVTFTSHSWSLRDHENDYRELMRAASQRERATTMITELSNHQAFPRSFNPRLDHRRLDVKRIDEESPCYLSGSFEKTVAEDLRFPWSRSFSSSGHNLNLLGRWNVNAV